MFHESIQRATLYTGLNLAVSAFYYFGVKERYIPGTILNKQVAAIGLSLIAQASRELLIDHDDRNKKSQLISSLLIHVAAITILGIGSYLSGVSVRTAIVASLALGLTQAQIADYIIYKGISDMDSSRRKPLQIPPYVPPIFPRPGETPIDEACQVLIKMNEGPLKRSAKIIIILTQAALSEDIDTYIRIYRYMFKDQPALRVALVCRIIELRERADLLQTAYETANAIPDLYLKAACMIRIAYAAKKLEPHGDFSQYFHHCTPDPLTDFSKTQRKEIKRWKTAFEKHTNDHIPSAIDDPGTHHMTRYAYHLQQGEIEEARATTREDERNLYWRVEALCEIARRKHYMS